MSGRRVLLVCYFYPPLAGGGVHRVLSFTRHLPERGWDCTVVCAGEEDYWVTDDSLTASVPPATEVIRVPGGSALSAWLRVRGGDRGRRSGRTFGGLRALADWCLLPDSYAGWAGRARAAALRRVARGGIDAVISSSPPDSAHLAGLALHRRTGLPWVADFRDPWVGLYLREPPTAWHRERHAAMERAVLDSADVVLTASATHARRLGARSGAAPREVVHLPNGFEPADRGPGPGPAPETFTLVFTGTLSQQPEIETVLGAMRDVLARRPEARGRLRARLAGPYDTDLAGQALALGLAGIVEFTGPLSHADTRALQRGADVLLLLKPPDMPTMVPGKTYEYLDAGPADRGVARGRRRDRRAGAPRGRSGAAPARPGRAGGLAGVGLCGVDRGRAPRARATGVDRRIPAGPARGPARRDPRPPGEAGARVILTLNGPVTRVERVGLLLGVALAAALMWPLRHYVTDDTYIHLQYARHLAHGQGLVFNLGERVYGCTSPLWVALIADGIAIGLDGLLVAKTIGFLATLASIGLFLQLMRRTLRSPGVRAAATVAWAGHAWMLRWSMSGMETPLAVALVLAGFVAFTEGRQWGSRPVRTGALWALAALTRPEAVFLLFLWALFLIIDTDSRPGLRRLVFGSLPPVLIYGGWLVFARAYFGTFWPQTLSAKSAGTGGFEVQLANLWRQLQIMGATDGVMAALLLVSLVFGARRIWPAQVRAQRLLPWVWVAAVPALYLARGVPVLSRYLLPLMPVLAWLAWRTAELWWLGDVPDPPRQRRASRLAAAVALLSLGLNLAVYRVKVVPHVTEMTRTVRTSLGHWGAWLRDHTPADAVVATPDIGVIGYLSQRRVLDTGGLVTPQMVPLLERVSVDGVDPRDAAVAALAFATFERPEWLLERGATAAELLDRSPYAAALEPIGSTAALSLGIARPGRTVYTLYRVHWESYDSLRALR